MITLSKDKNEVIVDTIIEGIHKKWNIYQLSKMIGKSVVQTCKILRDGAAANPKFAAAIEPLNWPTDIVSGHIYIGSYNTPIISNPAKDKINREIRELIRFRINNPEFAWMDKAKELLKQKRSLVAKTGGSMNYGERTGAIKPGQHVFAKPILSKPYSEIFLPVATRQRLIRFGHLVDGQFEKSKSKLSEAWFSKEDVLNDKITEYANTHGFTRIELSKSMRTVYTPDNKSLGAVNNRNLVSVTSDGT